MTINEMITQTIKSLRESAAFGERVSPTCTASATADLIEAAMSPDGPTRGRYGARPGKAWKPVIRALRKFDGGTEGDRVHAVQELGSILIRAKFDGFWREHYIDNIGFSTEPVVNFLRYGGGKEYNRIYGFRKIRKLVRKYGSVEGRVPFSKFAAMRAGMTETMVRTLLEDASHFDGGYTPKWVSTDPVDTKRLESFWNVRVTPVAAIIASDGEMIGGVVYTDALSPHFKCWPQLVLTRYLTWD